MIVTQRTRWPLVIHPHPVGVRRGVQQWSHSARTLGATQLPPRVLVIGSSTGLGLATRVIAASQGSATIGVCHARPGAPARPGSSGWYATAEVHALGAGRSHTVFADAFSDRAKELAARSIRDTVGKVDLVVYSIAARRRIDPDTGRIHRAVIAGLGDPFVMKTLDLATLSTRLTQLPIATTEQVGDTVAVMGGDDWQRWWRALEDAGVLADDARSIAFSYQGGELLRRIYRGGTLGAAKDHLEATARAMDTPDRPVRVVVTSAHVTQSSAVIPATPLYWSLLTHVLGDATEGPLHQMHRLFADVLYRDKTDEQGRIRVDDRELNPAVQAELATRWAAVDDDNLHDLAFPAAYRTALLRCSGFEVDGIDYAADVDPVVDIEGVSGDER
ncbi:bifunctional NADH-specific enoyl-ACP reductase/trans-2-enoyl-CoA reductase [Nocardia sp. NPDC101769]|uniref:bifunctional NADH-specific enoyl-ACP reductase/trans-2-enoyl-CoA reductase n=1 Tax=Nocardia sp. NPDC101769 TaxID=3364333 RepID=UPI003821BDAD